MTQDLQFSFKVFDDLPLYGILFDRDGRVITANKTFLNTIGLREKEIIGMSAEELEPYYVDLKKHLAELEARGGRTVRGYLVREDGTRFSVEHTFVHVTETEREIVASISCWYRFSSRPLNKGGHSYEIYSTVAERNGFRGCWNHVGGGRRCHG